VPIAIILALLVAWYVFTTTGTDRLVTGTVVRIEQVGAKQLKTRAIVRLGEARQVTVLLPNQTNCRTGSPIALVRRDNPFGASFRPALLACRG
jgi:hypothetical protein